MPEDNIISKELYDIIVKKLNRIPNETELRLFSAQWSEHCGYLHSRELLKREFKNTMEENAGYVEIDGSFIVFKVESHNHPSAVEPYQGAATGIGGIVRDIIAMGAYPIALLDSLRFGPIDNPESKNIFEGVVTGISDYGNSIGVPTVAGETYFHKDFTGNPLINVMCVGKVSKERLSSSIAVGEEISLVYVGGKTGRDGIHGASFASKKLQGKDDRPSVQIGDPFTEKNLIEATIEILNLKETLASQDMGAAGILSSSSEMAIKSSKGCFLNLDAVPLREEKMKAWEIMLSESQERMLFAVKKGCEGKIKEIAKKYFLEFAIIGELTKDKSFKISYKNEIKADLPIEVLVDSPSLYRKINMKTGKSNISYPNIRLNAREIFLKLLVDPNITKKSWIYSQYDYKVQTRTVVSPGYGDAAILWLKDGVSGIGITIDGNHLYTSVDPFEGSRNIVYEAARNLICTGAKPLGITDNMNFGNPEKDEVMWQFESSIKGIKAACEELKISITGGNVSFYNESNYGEIPPSPVIGMVGEVENIANTMTFDFKNPTDRVYLIGKTEIDKNKIGGSYYLNAISGFCGGILDRVNTKLEMRLHDFILYSIKSKLVNSVHDLSIGGLAIGLAKCALNGETGFKMDKRVDLSLENLFGENQSRFIVSISAEKERYFVNLLNEKNLPFEYIGEVMPRNWGIDMGFEVFTFEEMAKSYFYNIKEHMES